MKRVFFVFLAVVFFTGCGVFRKTDSGIGPTIGDRAIVGIGSWGNNTPQLLVNDYSTRIYPQGVATRSTRPSLPQVHGEGIYGDPHIVVFKNTTWDTVFRVYFNGALAPVEVVPGEVSAPQILPLGEHLLVVKAERQTVMGATSLPDRRIYHRVDPRGQARIINLY